MEFGQAHGRPSGHGEGAGRRHALRTIQQWRPRFLNVELDYPNPWRLTVVIWIQDRSRFGTPQRRYLGKTICVRGLVEAYGGVAEIEASSPGQIALA
jgi:hypothetical protein